MSFKSKTTTFLSPRPPTRSGYFTEQRSGELFAVRTPGPFVCRDNRTGAGSLDILVVLPGNKHQKTVRQYGQYGFAPSVFEYFPPVRHSRQRNDLTSQHLWPRFILRIHRCPPIPSPSFKLCPSTFILLLGLLPLRTHRVRHGRPGKCSRAAALLRSRHLICTAHSGVSDEPSADHSWMSCRSTSAAVCSLVFFCPPQVNAPGCSLSQHMCSAMIPMMIALLSAHGSPVCLRRKHLLNHNKPRSAAGKRNHVVRLLYMRPLSAAAIISILIVTLLRHYHTHQIFLMEMMMEKT